jgi:hypothetical protein
MAIKQYSISIFQQIQLLAHGILTIIAVPIGMIYFTGSILPTVWLLLPFGIFFSVNILPAIVLHIQYFKKNKTTVLVIDSEKRSFSISNSETVNSYEFSDITRIKFFGSYGQGTGFYSFGEYKYCEFILNDKYVFVITCLMVRDIDIKLRDEFGIEMEKKYRVFAFIK